MKLLIPKILLVGIFLSLQAEYKLIKIIRTDAELISTDSFGQLYIYSNNSLTKFNKNGQLLSIYSDQSNGKLSSIDVSDPYILLLFYQDLNRIVFLDDKMAPIGSPFDLDNMEIYNVSTVCKSKNFAVWIYDRFDNRLIQYGFNPKGVLHELKLDPLNVEQEVVFMLESGNYLYLNTGTQLILFDQYGTYIKSFQFEIQKAFQIWNNNVVYFRDKQLFINSVNEAEIDAIGIDFVADIKNVRIESDQLYIQKTDSVLIYKRRE
ncbi:MAG: hypothetical protein DRJ10_04460 [Bacteroidetes bacterium]|nr:MAG: hypothetical protein DRJ10_04460 [Bacteroidota bacterium]